MSFSLHPGFSKRVLNSSPVSSSRPASEDWRTLLAGLSEAPDFLVSLESMLTNDALQEARVDIEHKLESIAVYLAGDGSDAPLPADCVRELVLMLSNSLDACVAEFLRTIHVIKTMSTLPRSMDNLIAQVKKTLVIESARDKRYPAALSLYLANQSGLSLDADGYEPSERGMDHQVVLMDLQKMLDNYMRPLFLPFLLIDALQENLYSLGYEGAKLQEEGYSSSVYFPMMYAIRGVLSGSVHYDRLGFTELFVLGKDGAILDVHWDRLRDLVTEALIDATSSNEPYINPEAMALSSVETWVDYLCFRVVHSRPETSIEIVDAFFSSEALGEHHVFFRLREMQYIQQRMGRWFECVLPDFAFSSGYLSFLTVAVKHFLNDQYPVEMHRMIFDLMLPLNASQLSELLANSGGQVSFSGNLTVLQYLFRAIDAPRMVKFAALLQTLLVDDQRMSIESFLFLKGTNSIAANDVLVDRDDLMVGYGMCLEQVVNSRWLRALPELFIQLLNADLFGERLIYVISERYPVLMLSVLSVVEMWLHDHPSDQSLGLSEAPPLSDLIMNVQWSDPVVSGAFLMFMSRYHGALTSMGLKAALSDVFYSRQAIYGLGKNLAVLEAYVNFVEKHFSKDEGYAGFLERFFLLGGQDYVFNEHIDHFSSDSLLFLLNFLLEKATTVASKNKLKTGIFQSKFLKIPVRDDRIDALYHDLIMRFEIPLVWSYWVVFFQDVDDLINHPKIMSAYFKIFLLNPSHWLAPSAVEYTLPRKMLKQVIERLISMPGHSDVFEYATEVFFTEKKEFAYFSFLYDRLSSCSHLLYACHSENLDRFLRVFHLSRDIKFTHEHFYHFLLVTVFPRKMIYGLTSAEKYFIDKLHFDAVEREGRLNAILSLFNEEPYGDFLLYSIKKFFSKRSNDLACYLMDSSDLTLYWILVKFVLKNIDLFEMDWVLQVFHKKIGALVAYVSKHQPSVVCLLGFFLSLYQLSDDAQKEKLFGVISRLRSNVGGQNFQQFFLLALKSEDFPFTLSEKINLLREALSDDVPLGKCFMPVAGNGLRLRLRLFNFFSASSSSTSGSQGCVDETQPNQALIDALVQLEQEGQIRVSAVKISDDAGCSSDSACPPGPSNQGPCC